jgi:hypothetical protein
LRKAAVKSSAYFEPRIKCRILPAPDFRATMFSLQMRLQFIYLLCLLLITTFSKVHAQEARSRGTSIGLTTGAIGYQGDLQPNSFSLQEAQFFAGAYIRQPLLQKFSFKAGFNAGKLYAADANNRDYLKVRNLSFYTRLSEAFLTLEYDVLSLAQHRVTPFAFGGLVYFHFNPYTYDTTGTKYYLQPLGTEGQGLSRYPDRKEYKCSQAALVFGGGLRFLVSDAVLVNIEIGQRKTFTDYLDDVSKSYADRDALRAARGPKAVELAFRGNELSPNQTYPKEGEQRGTPTEMDWYYTTGISVEIRLSALAKIGGGKYFRPKDVYNMRCPKVN